MELECTCENISADEWAQKMKGARPISYKWLVGKIHKNLPWLYDALALQFPNPYDSHCAANRDITTYSYTPQSNTSSEKHSPMRKAAKLVTFAITTRVVVEENATDEKIIDVAIDKLHDTNPDEYLIADNLDEIRDDTECPYGTFDGEEEQP